MADIKQFISSPVALLALQGRLAAHGLVVDLSKPGEEKTGGWDISWEYPSPSVVAITIKSHPLLEENGAWSVIESALGKPI